MRPSKTLLLCMAMLAAMSLPASAVEGDYFTISGTVTDANWNPIPGALVTLYDSDFNRITTQDTTASGNFSFEGVSTKTNMCIIRISYTDANGTYSIPGYYIPALPAHGRQRLTPEQAHYDNFYLPGSRPRVTPAATLSPTNAPVPTAAPDNSQGNQALTFAGGFAIGAASAVLGCAIVLRYRGKI